MFHILFMQMDPNDEISKNICVPCADKIVEFHEFQSMYLESDRKFREMLSAKDETSLSSLMPFIKDDYECNAEQKSMCDGDSPEVFKWFCNKCPARYRTRHHLRQHKRNHRKKTETHDQGYIKLEPTGNWMDILAASKILPDDKDIIQPEVILSIADEVANKKMIMKIEQQAKVWRCSSCLLDFQTRRQLREHRKGHRDELIVKMESIDSEVFQLETDKQQNSTNGNNNENPAEIHATEEPGQIFDSNIITKWKCRECSKAFKARDFLRKHKQYHRQMHRNQKTSNGDVIDIISVQEKWLCHLCLSPFTTRNQLREHKQAHRQAKKQDENVTANVNIKNIDDIGDHVEDHNNHKIEKHFCKMCGICFSSLSNLNTHNRDVHRNGKKYKCKHCNQIFNYRPHLKSHINGNDTSECSHFLQAFYDSSNAKQHTMNPVQGIEAKYVCKICSKKFNRNDNLMMHMVTHTQQYPHQCKHCGIGFIRKYRLRQHMEKCEIKLFK